MALVRFEGGGSGGSEDVYIPTTDFVLVLDGQRFTPAATTEIQLENDGEMESVTDQCGRTEQARTSDFNWTMKVNFVIADGRFQVGSANNMSMADLKSIRSADTVEVESAPHSGTMELDNITIRQRNDLVSISLGDDSEYDAYECRLNLKEPSP